MLRHGFLRPTRHPGPGHGDPTSPSADQAPLGSDLGGDRLDAFALPRQGQPAAAGGKGLLTIGVRQDPGQSVAEMPTVKVRIQPLFGYKVFLPLKVLRFSSQDPL
jgi:hypothetical protein